MFFNLLPISCDDHACNDMEIKVFRPCLSDILEITSTSFCYLINYYAIKLDTMELVVDFCSIELSFMFMLISC